MTKLENPVLMATIGGAQGIRGDVRVKSYTADPTALGDYGNLHAADGRTFDKADPFATRAEHPPTTASVVWKPQHPWNDAAWMKTRGEKMRREAPMSIYECHLGSWRREQGSVLGYRELGVAQARRAWLAKEQVLNTRSWREIAKLRA